jgi:transcriptional regulator with XRE-family HTH domain
LGKEKFIGFGVEGDVQVYLAQNLKYLRMKSKETQKDISEFLGVSEMTVSRYESGDSEPDIETVIKLSEHYNLSIDDLLLKELRPLISIHASNLRFLREKYGMKQKDMANLLGISIGAESKYENGRIEPPIESLIKIADYFNITLDQLVKEDLVGGD